MTVIKERPILFSAPMVNAIREGRKTMTRRIVKQPNRKDGVKLLPDLLQKTGVGAACPYGVVGDRLWVKEGLEPVLPNVGDTELVAAYAADGELVLGVDGRPVPWRWQTVRLPAIFMPRWASRILLEITDVRVELLNRISEADAMAEGCKKIRESCYVFGGTSYDKAGLCHSSPSTAFAVLWDEINGPDSWAANPWVWAITFRRIDA